MRKKIVMKGFALMMVGFMLFETIAPTLTFALTSGPDQPEMSGFESAGTTDMVDVFSGDFKYNIPLLTIPGPNGGYPINIVYNGGVTMEEEASWVGLGWSLNLGAINRQMRGLPDDFKGENLSKDVNIKKDKTVAVSPSFLSENTTVVSELFGIPLKLTSTTNSFDLTFRYNNYTKLGIGMGYGLVSESRSGIGSFLISSKTAGFNIGLDSQNGISLDASANLFKRIDMDTYRKFQAGFGINSRNGLSRINLSGSRKALKVRSDKKYSRFSGNAIIDLTHPAYTPKTSFSMAGASVKFKAKFGVELFGGSINAMELEGLFSMKWIKDKEQEIPAYGYLYSEERVENGPDRSVMDINREREFPVTRDAPNLPLPVATPDIFVISGQGTGGAFRAVRNDIGVYHDSKENNDFFDGGAGIDFDPPTPQTKFGVNIGLSYSNSYSGAWKDKWDDIQAGYQFQENDPANPLRERYHFKSLGEMNESDSEKGRFDNDSPLALEIKNSFDVLGLSFEPKVFNKKASNGNTALNYNQRQNREKRVQNIEQYTREEIRNTFLQRISPNIVPTLNGSYTTAERSDFASGGGKNDNHIGMFIVRNPDGNSYVYGIPTYNNKHKDFVFAVDELANPDLRVVDYDEADASIANDEGNDNYFESNAIPAYANSFLLTEVYSPDYVDLKNDGPSEDDLGYYVKMNYYKSANDFKWRTPFSHATYAPGNHSNSYDDKATFMYGERENWYVHSVETKTHVAVFVLELRNDGYGAYEEHNEGDAKDTDSRSYLLKEIKLYSKKNMDVPIKTVVFEYDYSLCDNIPNNDGASPASENATSNEGGKLTLKKIYFTHLGNRKGSLSPYEFIYSSTNPNYSKDKMDRWGFFKDNSYASHLESKPYVQQNDDELVDTYMNAWSLTQVKLPSGGKINIEYESDDYAYVQDKRAMQMMEIVGTTTSSTNEYAGSAGKLYEGTNKFTRIYFDLEQPTGDANILNEYIAGIDSEHPLYFKAYIDLKKSELNSSIRAYEYVDGYCYLDYDNLPTLPIGFDPSSEVTTGIYSRAYIDVKQTTVNQTNTIEGHTHPFSKAAWEYLKLERHDLLYASEDITDDNSGGWGNNLLAPFTNLAANWLFGGYYAGCKSREFANKIKLGDAIHPSFVRLNTPDKIKKGGGQRVKKITMNDGWSEITSEETVVEDSFEYGVTYEYRMADGTSSGVAEYEPLIGGEEIPHHLPTDRYSSTNRKFTRKDDELYQQEPIGESYFPGASVGYRRIVVRSLKRLSGETEINKFSADGVTVHEFYTAKEFPVIVEKTNVESTHYSPTILIPFIGVQSTDNHGYSQGYAIELNNMHGKQKAIYTYPHNADIDDPATPYTARQEFTYSTESPFSENQRNRLKNTVTVLDGDANYRTASIGQTTEFFIDMIENSTWALDMSSDFNTDVIGVVVVPTWFPEINYSEGMYRSVVTNKIIYKNGILIETKSESEGSKATARNLMFDAETGNALLIESINNFDQPVYSYTYPVHWNYKGMQGAYKNYGMSITPTSPGTISSGKINYSNAGNLFNIGDKLVLRRPSDPTYEEYWVSSIDVALNNVSLVDRDGSAITSGTWNFLRVVESVRKNQQAVSSGTIVSLTNPVTARDFPMFTALNTFLHEPGTSFPDSFTYEECPDNTSVTVNVTFSSNTLVMAVPDGERNKCNMSIVFPSNVTAGDLADFTLTKKGNLVFADYTGSDGSIQDFTYEIGCFECSCFKECLDGVLHATSSVFSDNWNFNYADVGEPTVDLSTVETILTSTIAAMNPWRFGTRGIWRNLSQYAYQVDRKQSAINGNSETNIGVDGTYENFVLFNWLNTTYNDHWTKTNTVTQYNPFGFEVENKNILDIYSSAIYGYGNSAVTAVGANTSYMEMAFDSFEDYETVSSVAYTDPGHGHLDLRYDGTSTVPEIYYSDAHTGTACLNLDDKKITYSSSIRSAVPGATTGVQFFSPVYNSSGDNKYVISAWFKTDFTPKINITGSNISDVVQRTSKNKIEGWTHVETEFTITASSGTFDLEIFSTVNGTDPEQGYVDDLRIQPYRSAVTTYVYDPITLWLLAELDNRNYATFYNYDEEGTIVQIKKETERGVKTVQTSRQNIRKSN